MRNIINISLPPQLKEEVEAEVEKGNFASTSEFFRYLLRLWQEKKLLKELNQSRREIKNGRGKVLRSLKDLR